MTGQSKKEDLIRQELLKLITASSDNIKVAKVISVSSSKKTCKVKIVDNDLEATARLRPSEDGVEKGIWMTPKTNSLVIIGRMTQFKRYVVLMYDELEAMQIVCDAVKFNNGANGGIVKSQVVSDQIANLVSSINDLKTILATWVPVPSDGGLALKTAVTAWAGTALTPILKAEYENDKIKH